MYIEVLNQEYIVILQTILYGEPKYNLFCKHSTMVLNLLGCLSRMQLTGTYLKCIHVANKVTIKEW